MYLGIAFISVPKSIQQAGIYGALIGFCYVVIINVYCIYILLKARNRFKREEIVDLSDLSAKLYGESSRWAVAGLLLVINSMILMCYTMYFGT
jgi:hypothetical protein